MAENNQPNNDVRRHHHHRHHRHHHRKFWRWFWIVILETVRFKPSRKLFVTCLCYILCIVATVADILYFYLSGSSNNITSTLMIFLVYIVTMGILSVTELNQEANTDFCTGLFNRSRCNELILDKTPVSEQTCFMMFDLNGLKRINDTRGHEVGDRLISGFAKVFRHSKVSSRIYNL